MLNQKQITYIVKKVNEKVNVPIIGEKAEAQLIEKGVKKILALLEKELPEEVQNIISDAAEGVQPDMDLTEIKANTVEFLNKEINLPIVGEKFEKELFTEVVDILFNAMKKGENV